LFPRGEGGPKESVWEWKRENPRRKILSGPAKKEKKKREEIEHQKTKMITREPLRRSAQVAYKEGSGLMEGKTKKKKWQKKKKKCQSRTGTGQSSAAKGLRCGGK